MRTSWFFSAILVWSFLGCGSADRKPGLIGKPASSPPSRQEKALQESRARDKVGPPHRVEDLQKELEQARLTHAEDKVALEEMRARLAAAEAEKQKLEALLREKMKPAPAEEQKPRMGSAAMSSEDSSALRKALDQERSAREAAEKALRDAQLRLAELRSEKPKSESTPAVVHRDDQTLVKLLELGQELYARNDYEAARKLLAGLAELGFENGAMFFLLGCCCHELGDLNAALSNYGRACDVFERMTSKPPQFVHALNNMGVILRGQGRYTEAAEAYQRAVKVDPTYATAYYNLGVLYDDYLKDKAQALAAFERYIDLRGQKLQEAEARVKRLKEMVNPPRK